MDVITLKAMLQAEKADALSVNTSQLSTERARALDYYYGNMASDMPSADGRSSAVSTDVADTVEGILPSLMEIFASTEEPARFNPVGPEDMEAADQETDYVNHVLMQKNPGFLIIYSFIKDALLSKVGIVKVDWETTDRDEIETYHNQDDDTFAVMVADPDVEVVAHTEHKDPETGATTHDVTLSKRKNSGNAKVMPVPPEEFGISKRARNIKDADYAYHEVQRAQSDLIEQGYDKAQVETLPTMSVLQRAEALARDTVEQGSRANTAADSVNRAMRPIKITEHYIRMDYDGSGKARLYRVTTGGDELQVLTRDGEPDVVMVDCMPFAAMTPVIITHRFFGRSLADIVLDIQKIKTALLRALLDNAYLALNPRAVVNEQFAGERTIDDLLVSRPNGVIRTKAPGAIEWATVPDVTGFAVPLLGYVDQTREFRTGVSKMGQGLSPDALQNQTAQAVNQAFTAAQAKMKLIARIFAETGIRDLIALLHGVIRKNDKKANTVRLRNKWVTVDPREWKSRDDMTIQVGLGTGSKEAQIAHLMTLLGIQKEVMLARGPIVTWKNVYNTVAKIAEKVDLKTAEPYFTDPDSQEGQQLTAQAGQQQPDPNMMKVQGQLSLQAQKQQADVATAAQKVQTDAAVKTRQQDIEADLERQRIATDAQTKIATAVVGGHAQVATANATRPIELGGRTG